MEPEKIVDNYNKELSRQIDGMKEDEAVELTKALVEYTNSIEPDEQQCENVIRFLERDDIPGQTLIEAVRDLSMGSMHSKLVSEKLAINLGRHIDQEGNFQ